MFFISLARNNILEKIIEKINLFIDKGVSHFMLWFMDYPDQKGIKLFNDKIISNYR